MIKRFNEEFKKTIVELYRSGSSTTSLAKEYDISKSAVYKWVRMYQPLERSPSEFPNLSTTNSDYLKLKKELSKLKEDNNILKKALTIFSTN